MYFPSGREVWYNQFDKLEFDYLLIQIERYIRNEEAYNTVDFDCITNEWVYDSV